MHTTMNDRVDAAIANVIQAAARLAACKGREMELEGQRSQMKSDAIARIMSLDDPQKPGKTYSATAAADVVMFDKAFALHESDRRTATTDTIRAAGEYEAAKFAARHEVSRNEIAGYEPLRLSLDNAHRMALA